LSDASTGEDCCPAVMRFKSPWMRGQKKKDVGGDTAEKKVGFCESDEQGGSSEERSGAPRKGEEEGPIGSKKLGFELRRKGPA